MLTIRVARSGVCPAVASPASTVNSACLGASFQRSELPGATAITLAGGGAGLAATRAGLGR